MVYNYSKKERLIKIRRTAVDEYGEVHTKLVDITLGRTLLNQAISQDIGFNGEVIMEKNKSFFIGLLVGMALMTGIFFSAVPIRSYLLWGGVASPETKILEMYHILTNHSIIPFDKDNLLDSMYRGFMDAVDDPFTYYFDRESLRSFTNRTGGTFAGVGMLVTLSQYNQVTVVTVFSGSPAEENGMLPGDVLLAVDGNPSEGLRLEEVTGAVQGTPGTDVTLSILRNDYEFDVTITRRIIQVPSVEHRMLEDNIGFLRLISFDGVTYNQFRAAYDDLKSQGLEGLIIDLRNNTGGRLQTVVDISSMLIPAGVIMYSENVTGERTIFESESEEYIGLPLVILVNGSSASASEVLAGAVRDHNTGTIVGQQTFGKGVVQSIHTLSDGSGISVTVAEYFTPNGISIHGYGLTPDYIVEVDRETAFMAARLTLEEDIQLQKALEVLSFKNR